MNFKITTLALVGTALLASCNARNSVKGGALGAGLGGALGGIIGKNSDKTTEGILIGAAIGGAAGAAIGHYMDRQARELQRDLENAKVERVGEGIKITFASGILFDTNSATLRSASKENITQLATTLQKYDDTEILIQGYTDSTGSDDHNLKLSDERANSVARYLKTLGVKGGRVQTEGMGEQAPVADNESDSGRQQNRRVEVAIYANDKLKKAAEKGDL